MKDLPELRHFTPLSWCRPRARTLLHLFSSAGLPEREEMPEQCALLRGAVISRPRELGAWTRLIIELLSV